MEDFVRGGVEFRVTYPPTTDSEFWLGQGGDGQGGAEF